MSTNSEKPVKRYRKYLTHLPIEDYLKLELVAYKAGEKPYTLAARIVSAYLRGDLVPAEKGAAPSPSQSVAQL